MPTVKEQVVNELLKPARKNFKRRSVILNGIDDLWQADLVELRPYRRKNQGYALLLCVIDCFSKFAWCSPLKRKSGAEITKAFTEILKRGRIPKNLQTDDGKEFYNKRFNALMKKYKINHYSTFSNLKASIVERFNRTIKTKLWKKFYLHGTYHWLSIIQPLVSEYNKTKHRTIGMTPASVKGKQIEKYLLRFVYDRPKSVFNAKYKVGQHVRISKYKALFSKGYTPSWSTEIFRINKVKRTSPVTYHLKDVDDNEIEGGFYQEELQAVKYPDAYLVEKILKRKGDKVRVKWLGFDSSHNSWEKAKNIL